jgi:hypothetical protein
MLAVDQAGILQRRENGAAEALWRLPAVNAIRSECSGKQTGLTLKHSDLWPLHVRAFPENRSRACE